MRGMPKSKVLVSVGVPVNLNFALFLKKIYGLPTKVQLGKDDLWPPPYLQNTESESVRTEAAGDWDTWWASLVQVNAEMISPPPDPTVGWAYHGIDPDRDFASQKQNPVFQKMCRNAWKDFFSGFWGGSPASMSFAVGRVYERFSIGRTLPGSRQKRREPLPIDLLRSRLDYLKGNLRVGIVYANSGDGLFARPDYIVLGSHLAANSDRLEQWLKRQIRGED